MLGIGEDSLFTTAARSAALSTHAHSPLAQTGARGGPAPVTASPAQLSIRKCISCPRTGVFTVVQYLHAHKG